MNDIQVQMNTRIIEKTLQGLSGVSFEEHARFILKLTDQNFTFTQLRQDGGIDGYNRINENTKKEITDVISIYSIYGKEASTPKNSSTVKSKIMEDFTDAMDYAEKWHYQLNSWKLVINFELETEFRTKLENLCKEKGMSFEEINPTVLVTKLWGEEMIYTAACYFNAMTAPKLPYSTFANYEIAKRALIDISQNVKSSTNEKLDLLKEITSTILKVSFLEVKNPLNLLYRYKSNTIAKNTMVPEKDIYHYKFVEGAFLPTDEPMEGKWDVSGYCCKDKNDFVTLSVYNLCPIFLLCIALLKQLEQTGTFNISEALAQGFNDIELGAILSRS